MAALLRLLALTLLLSLALPATANEGIGKNDLDAQKELLLLKIDNGRELVQKDIEGFKTRIDALDKRMDDQNNRVGDIGQSVDRFATAIDRWGLVVTVLLVLGGLVGYFSVAKKAAEEAESASQKWFNDNHQKLAAQIRKVEEAVAQSQEAAAQAQEAVAQAHREIVDSVNDVKKRGDAAIEQMQKGPNAPNEQASPTISPIEQQALHRSAEQIRGKPEASYSFEDWNTRAFDAYYSKRYEDAALYWRHASNISDTGATDTTQALFNRAVALRQLNQHDEACTTYKQLIDTYSHDNTPVIREQVAKAMNNMGVILGMQKPAEAIVAFEKLINTYSLDDTPAIREQVAKAMFNMGVALWKILKLNEAIDTYKKLIDTYSHDDTPAIREQVAKAMFNMSVALWKILKPDEAIDTYKKLIDTYSHDDTPAIREQVVKAMFNMDIALAHMQKPDEAIDTYEKLIDTYLLDDTPAIREQVAKVMFNTGVLKMQRPAEAIDTYKKLIDTYSHDDTPTIREQVAKAMFNMGVALWKILKPNEAIDTYKKLIDTYSHDDTPAIREQVGKALNGKGFGRLMEVKEAWKDRSQALALLREARVALLAGLDLRPDCGVTRGNLAYTQFLLDDQQAAEESFRAALAAARNGGEALYHNALGSIALHPIPEDNAFRSMVELLWAEHQAASHANHSTTEP